MGATIEDNDRLWQQFVNGLQQIARGPSTVVTGIQEGVKNGKGLEVAQYAAVNEFGTVIRRTSASGPVRATVIPARPFMRLYFDNNFDKIARFSENALTKAMQGKVSMHQALSAIGVYTQSGLRNQIKKSSDYVPNAPLTIKLKGSDKPLIEHAILLANVSFELRR